MHLLVFPSFPVFTLGVQGSIWFFGAETPKSGVILVAGREPICLVCLTIAALLLPKNSAEPAGGQKSGLARPQDEGGLISHQGRERSQLSFWLLQAYCPLYTEGTISGIKNFFSISRLTRDREKTALHLKTNCFYVRICPKREAILTYCKL